jgi:spore coat protein CotF
MLGKIYNKNLKKGGENMVQGQSWSKGQSTQQQLGGQGVQFSDQDILQLALNSSKHHASALNTYILEANTEHLRRDYMTIIGDVYNQQKQISDLMQQKGYYNVQNATSQDINQARSKFSS